MIEQFRELPGLRGNALAILGIEDLLITGDLHAQPLPRVAPQLLVEPFGTGQQGAILQAVTRMDLEAGQARQRGAISSSSSRPGADSMSRL